jgi:peptide chain release factor 2
MEHAELTEAFSQLQSRIDAAAKLVRLDEKKKESAELKTESNKTDFWSDQDRARRTMQKIAALDEESTNWEGLLEAVRSSLEMVPLATSDPQIRSELEQTLASSRTLLDKLEFELLFSGPYDSDDVYLSIYAGTGGTDAQDWAEMLLRMYLRFAERKDWKTQIESISSGEEAGIKSVTVKIEGRTVYGHLKAEHGVHRLVRQSPFNAQNLRQTSFALVDVLPIIENEAFQLDEKELRIDTFRSSGHGGQSVNTTDSAVRITHIPTGLTASCQNERSQLQNKERAMQLLRSKLIALQQKERAEQAAEIRGETSEPDWGSQIRSYVLHPYQMVKDHRSNYETSNTSAVLDGALDEFIEAELRHETGHRET